MKCRILALTTLFFLLVSAVSIPAAQGGCIKPKDVCHDGSILGQDIKELPFNKIKNLLKSGARSQVSVPSLYEDWHVVVSSPVIPQPVSASCPICLVTRCLEGYSCVCTDDPFMPVACVKVMPPITPITCPYNNPHPFR